MSTQNYSNEFITNENVELLWEIIYDDYSFNKKNISEIKQNFIYNINSFYETIKHNNKSDIVSLNKEFISKYINFLEKEKEKEKEKVDEINVKNKEPILVTFEEIQGHKMNEFENALKLKKQNFEDSMTIKVPNVPNFKDNQLDKPIGEMEDLIAKTLAQRNFEIEQIHNKFLNPEEAEKWLHPQETSLKSEKGLQNIQNDKSSIIKPILSLENKHVTWNDNITIEIKEKNDIFSKLKLQIEPEIQPEIQPLNIMKLQMKKSSESLSNQNDIKMLQDEIKNINNKLDKVMEMNALLLKFFNYKKIE